MEFLGNNGALIEAARREFSSFYATALPEDVGMMNALVITHAVLLRDINTPRKNLPPMIREALESAYDATERVFADLRENVRCCSSYRKLPPPAQKQIVRLVFHVRPQWLFETASGSVSAEV